MLYKWQKVWNWTFPVDRCHDRPTAEQRLVLFWWTEQTVFRLLQCLKACNHCNRRTTSFSKTTQSRVIKWNGSQFLCTYYFYMLWNEMPPPLADLWSWIPGVLRGRSRNCGSSVVGQRGGQTRVSQQHSLSFLDHKWWLVSEIPLILRPDVVHSISFSWNFVIVPRLLLAGEVALFVSTADSHRYT